MGSIPPPAADRQRQLLNRNHVVVLLFNQAELDCGSIAQLTWEDVRTIKAPPVLSRALKELHWSEREHGFGSPHSHVVRFHGGTSKDPVVRANAVLRLIRGTDRPVTQAQGGKTHDVATPRNPR